MSDEGQISQELSRVLKFFILPEMRAPRVFHFIFAPFLIGDTSGWLINERTVNENPDLAIKWAVEFNLLYFTI